MTRSQRIANATGGNTKISTSPLQLREAAEIRAKQEEKKKKKSGADKPKAATFKQIVQASRTQEPAVEVAVAKTDAEGLPPLESAPILEVSTTGLSNNLTV